QKYEIAYLLASFLRPGEIYDSARLDEYIARTVKPDILGRRGYFPDHLRRCMIDNDFLRREPDGSRYWVSGSCTGPEEERNEEEGRRELLLRGAGEEKAVCPYCGARYSGGVLLRHYEKKHSSVQGYWRSGSRSTSAGRDSGLMPGDGWAFTKGVAHLWHESNKGRHPTRDEVGLSEVSGRGRRTSP
ncbi:MAG TPA: DUF2087 domain-containing protein, partial [Pyrinomonadaceae bacterium]